MACYADATLNLLGACSGSSERVRSRVDGYANGTLVRIVVPMGSGKSGGRSRCRG